MIKTALKILIALAILNAAFRGGAVAWDYYQLRDEAEQMIIFGGNSSTTELHNRILAKAVEFRIPLQSENLTVRRDGLRTVVNARYAQPLEYFPNQIYPLNLSFMVEAYALNPSTADETTR